MKVRTKSKSKTIYTVLIDEEIWGILPKKILHFFSLPSEKEIRLSKEEIIKLLSEIEKYVWSKLLNYISFSERSVWQCKNYLEQLPLNECLVEKLADRAVAANYVNDQRFAELYVEHLINKSKNPREIKSKLLTKHIDDGIINEVILNYFTPEKQEEILNLNIMKALTRYSKYPEKEKKEKVLNYLTRRGFSYWEIKEKLDKIRG